MYTYIHTYRYIYISIDRHIVVAAHFAPPLSNTQLRLGAPDTKPTEQRYIYILDRQSDR